MSTSHQHSTWSMLNGLGGRESTHNHQSQSQPARAVTSNNSGTSHHHGHQHQSQSQPARVVISDNPQAPYNNEHKHPSQLIPPHVIVSGNNRAPRPKVRIEDHSPTCRII